MAKDRYSIARNKTDNINIKNAFKSKRLFVKTCIEEMKPVVIGDKGRWVWMQRKNTDKRFCSGNLDCQDSNATNIIKSFSSQRSSTNGIF